jgi:epoxyqueuosine reductase
MSEKEKFKLNRRDFLRFAGVGAGAAAVATVVKPAAGQHVATFKAAPFSDPAGRPKRPWWVKTVDQPTSEIDWDRMQRFDERMGTVRGPGFAGYIGAMEVDRLTETAAQMEKQRMLDNVDGYTLKDQALRAAHVGVGRSYLGPQRAATPEERGVPKWTGTPEEAAKIIRAAMRHFGASSVGFMELNEQTRKLIYAVDPDGKELIFTDEEEAYETDDARYIPNKCKYVIVYTVQMSVETMRRSPTALGSQTTSLAYRRSETIQGSTQEFLRGLGYQGLSESSTNALGIAPAMGILAGLGEQSRLNRMITPEFGPMVRVSKILTDLPLALDKPIDAGIMEFCRRCKKCAEACPSESLSFADEPTWETQGDWNNPGHKAYFENAVTCRAYWREQAGTNCGICFAVCPFSKKDKAWVHEWVKAGSATAPFMINFFRSMDDAFGYGTQANAEEWWNLDLPEYGIDSNQPVQEI